MTLPEGGHTTPGSQAWWTENCEDSHDAQRKTMWQGQQGTAEQVRNKNIACADTPLHQRPKAPHMETKSPVIL